jgi:hypothetical protein
MKKVSLVLVVIIACIVAIVIAFNKCSNNPVKEIFQKDWKTMSSSDKAALEKFLRMKVLTMLKNTGDCVLKMAATQPTV